MQLVTLGELRLVGTDFTRPKPLLLLSYLTIEGRRSRRVLADLFFPDVKDPRDSLSTAVRQLDQCDPELLAADGNWLAANASCDAVELIDALDGGLLERAAEGYGGAFLAGVDLELAEELEEWVFTTREYLAGRVRDAWIRQAEEAAARGMWSLAARHAEAAVDLSEAPPLMASDYPRVFGLLSAGRSPRAAELEKSAKEYGLDVEAEAWNPKALLGAIHEWKSPTPHNLPAPTTTFVGRDDQRMEISNLLGTPQARVITIHGPGGIGKSRLALRVARDQLREGRFAQGTYVVDLESLGSPDQIVDAITAALSLDHATTGDSIDELTRYLRDKRMLLVLDGFEHVVEGAHFVSEIAAACYDVRILVTSRMRLNIAEEYVLTLEGLALPPDAGSREDAVYADAVQLLVQRAKKTRVDFELREEDVDQAVALSRILGGSPLAIELAMAWVHALSLQDIRTEIESDVGFLEARSQNVPDRHRSLRAVFEGSWRLLGPTAREVLPKLAVFRSGFRREAASAVAGATLPVLVQLTDASLVSVRPDGRYGLHALIQQFSLEALGTTEHVLAETLDAHAAYFRDFTDRVLGMMYADKEAEALVMLRNELPNVLAAWARTLATRRGAQLAFPAELVVFFDRVGLYQEGLRFFQGAEAELNASDPLDARWLVEIWANMAWIEYRTGNTARAEDLATKAARAGGPTDRATMIAWNTLGLVFRKRDRPTAAMEAYGRAIEIARGRGELNRAAMYNVNLAIVARELGDLGRAKQLLDDTIATARTTNYSYLLVNAWNNLAAILEEEGNFSGARSLYTQALDLAEATGYGHMRSLLLANIAEAHLESGDIAASTRTLAKAEASAVDERDDLLGALIEDIRGRIQLSLGNVDRAEEAFLRGLEKSVAHPHDRRHLKILVHLAELWADQGAHDKALWVLSRVLPQTTKIPTIRNQVERLIASMPENVRQSGGIVEAAEGIPMNVVRDLTETE